MVSHKFLSNSHQADLLHPPNFSCFLGIQVRWHSMMRSVPNHAEGLHQGFQQQQKRTELKQEKKGVLGAHPSISHIFFGLVHPITLPTCAAETPEMPKRCLPIWSTHQTLFQAPGLDSQLSHEKKKRPISSPMPKQAGFYFIAQLKTTTPNKIGNV